MNVNHRFFSLSSCRSCRISLSLCLTYLGSWILRILDNLFCNFLLADPLYASHVLGLHLGVCAVWFARYFFKFVTEPIGIGFVIIKTNVYRLGSVFRPMVVRFDRLGLIGLVGLI